MATATATTVTDEQIQKDVLAELMWDARVMPNEVGVSVKNGVVTLTESHADEDAQRRQEIELRNQTDALVYSVERALREHGSQLSETDRKDAEQALADAKEALNGQDMEPIRRVQDALDRAASVLSSAAKSSAFTGGGTQGQPGPQQSGEPGPDVVDAEFQDVKDKGQ